MIESTKEFDYIKIKLKWVSEDIFSDIFLCHFFEDGDEIVKVEGAWKDSEGNIRDLNGNLIELLSSIGETIEERQRFVAVMEQSRHANNHAWTKQSFWDMPPGWK